MALCTMKQLMADAQKDNRAVGSFSVGNMEMIIGAIKAAEDSNTPILIQIAEVRLGHSPLELIGPMMVSAAKHAKVDIGVHFDHGLHKETIRQALELGFTSVMYDGSHLPFLENLTNTKDMIQVAKQYNATIEAELGIVGGSEDGSKNHKIICTDPNQALQFVESTKVDALAVAIGNAHGNYPVAPTLEFDALKEISSQVNIPLVLHGGTGISPSDFQRAITLGIHKINIATASFDCLVTHAKEYLFENSSINYFGLNEAMIAGVYDNITKHITIFNNKEGM